MMKKVMRVFVMLMIALVVTVGYPVSVHAEDALTETQFSQFMTASQPIDAKTGPDDNAATAFSYDAGAIVYVTGETENGWYVVSYQGKTGYINKNSSQDVLTTAGEGSEALGEESNTLDKEPDTLNEELKALDEELEALQVRDKIIIDSVERFRTERRRSRIWGTIIVILVIGIFAVGIFSTIRAEKKKKGDEDEVAPESSLKSGGDVKDKPQYKNSEKKAYSGRIIDLDKEK